MTLEKMAPFQSPNDEKRSKKDSEAGMRERGTVERAIEIALEAHAGQKLPTGEPYILHPLRMPAKMKSPEEQIVALLHDVVEKTSRWNVRRLRHEGVSREDVEAVDALTKRKGETFAHSVGRAGHNEIGRKVKRADLTDHLQHFPRGPHSAELPDALLSLIAHHDHEPIGGYPNYSRVFSAQYSQHPIEQPFGQRN